MLQISVAAVIAGSLGWSWLIYSEFRSPVLVAPAIAAVDQAAVDVTSNVVKSAGTSAYARVRVRRPGHWEQAPERRERREHRGAWSTELF